MLSHIQLLVALWIGGRLAPLPMEFSRQEYWGGVPFPTPGDLSHPGIELAFLASLALAADSLPLVPPGKPSFISQLIQNIWL